MRRVEIRLTDEECKQVDQACGLVPRATWIQAVLVTALGAGMHPTDGSLSAVERHTGYGPDVTRYRSSRQSKTGVQPITRK